MYPYKLNFPLVLTVDSSSRGRRVGQWLGHDERRRGLHWIDLPWTLLGTALGILRTKCTSTTLALWDYFNTLLSYLLNLLSSPPILSSSSLSLSTFSGIYFSSFREFLNSTSIRFRRVQAIVRRSSVVASRPILSRLKKNKYPFLKNKPQKKARAPIAVSLRR